MEKQISISESGLNMVFSIDSKRHISLLHCSALPFALSDLEGVDASEFRAVEVQVTGENRPEDCLGTQMIHLMPSGQLRYQ